MIKRFGGDTTKAYDAAAKAQFLAFAPAFFQAIILLRDKGVLNYLNENDEGKTEKEITDFCRLNEYSARILLEAGEETGVLIYDKDKKKYYISKVGFLLINDEVTRRNMNFINDVCYQGLFYLDESIETQKPAGLKVFGNWETIYAGLMHLPEKVKKSWFEFDHYYSDTAFEEALEIIFTDKNCKKLLDVGGNTGRFALKAAEFSNDVKITILDHECQLKIAKENAVAAGFGDRVDGFAMNLLDHCVAFPKNYDAVWLSQFLDCFPPEDIVQLLMRGSDALAKNGYLYVMEPYVDNQKHPQAKLSLVGTSLYFTAIANGTSRMYHCSEMLGYARQAGLTLVEKFTGIGEFQTILKFRKV